MKIDNSQHSFNECDVCFLGLNKSKSKTPNPLNPKSCDLLRFAINNKDDYDITDDKCCFDELKICDLKNLNDFKTILNKLKNQKLIILGGEHSITKDCFLSLKEKIKDLHLIVFDAHLDVRTDWEENACFLRKIIKKSNPKNIHLIGQRMFSKEEHDFLKKNDLKILKDLNIKNKKIYISFDIDVIDSVFVPTCSTPEPFGENLKYYNDLLLKLIKNNELIAIDFVEFSGKKFDITYSNIASVIINILKILKKKHLNKN